ncbi:TldD/PmbA family protein [candidate division WOR-3 bacterium]|uniref:TldD/PmbA family protein n=1 Tax=candidate division WOR-3 bacterium TaxID=2052148 RepID=A0A938BSH2_UNCW3|nr:TldD/PmbA family protein [candidate division WOR-3 bacterium]
MERLLDIARKHADAVTVYQVDGTQDGVGFENGRLKNADSAMSSGTALTIIKDGRQGFAYTRNLIDREGLVRDALAALAGGVEAPGELPQPVKLPQLDTTAEQVGGNALLAEECRRMTDYLSNRVKGQVNVGASRSEDEVRLLTSSGVDARSRSTQYFAMAGVLYPGTYSGINRVFEAKRLTPFPDADLKFIADTYNVSLNEAKGVPGRSRVLFLPGAVYALAWRLTAATNARAVYQKVSPLVGRIGEKILSDKLTLADEPLNDRLPGARAFDDEGTPCRDSRLFERGVLEGFYNDRFYARKTGTRPTGHGYRDTVTSRPMPSLRHLTIAPGDRSLDGLLKLMGRGVVVAGVMGAHSGNILHGDYSVGLAPGLWVENGEIVGVVKDAMVAGNVYEDLTNIIAVGDTVYPGPMGRFPALLLDNISFSARA